jgi:hypothetical protein
MSDIIKTLGIAKDGKLVLGGFFTAHDTHGYHVDWFMSMFLNPAQFNRNHEGFHVSVPYFVCECLQHEDRDPDIVWGMLEAGYREARIPFDVAATREKTNFYLAREWTLRSGPSLRDLSLALMREMEDNGKKYEEFHTQVVTTLVEALQLAPHA